MHHIVSYCVIMYLLYCIYCIVFIILCCSLFCVVLYCAEPHRIVSHHINGSIYMKNHRDASPPLFVTHYVMVKQKIWLPSFMIKIHFLLSFGSIYVGRHIPINTILRFFCVVLKMGRRRRVHRTYGAPILRWVRHSAMSKYSVYKLLNGEIHRSKALRMISYIHYN